MLRYDPKGASVGERGRHSLSALIPSPLSLTHPLTHSLTRPHTPYLPPPQTNHPHTGHALLLVHPDGGQEPQQLQPHAGLPVRRDPAVPLGGRHPGPDQRPGGRDCQHPGTFVFCPHVGSQCRRTPTINHRSRKHSPTPPRMAARQAILPGAARYEGANGGTVSVGGGTVANVLTQVVAFPSANSTVAPKGVDQVRVLGWG